jgi:sulfite reductase (ferredoxin)
MTSTPHLPIALETGRGQPEELPSDLAKVAEVFEQFQRGVLGLGRFKAARVTLGVYEERSAGTFMIRVRLAGGNVTADQARALAHAATQFGNGLVHLTTRRDVQLRDVSLRSVLPALTHLRRAGLNTSGGGGNTVRAITACDQAGVCPLEPFDVTPWSVALTRFLLQDPMSLRLPRKLKIAFSGCNTDCAIATVQDLGFVARVREREHGFAVFAGGGFGASSRVGQSLDSFVPASRIHEVALAVMRVFHEHGNWKNRRRARLRFLVERIGLDRFSALVREQRDRLVNLEPLAIDVDALPRLRSVESSAELGPHAALWRKRNVEPQKQAGRFIVHVHVPDGDIESDALLTLAHLADELGDGTLTISSNQNLAIRWIPEHLLSTLQERLASHGLSDAPPSIVRGIVACAGSATCKLGMCNAKAMAHALRTHIAAEAPDIDDSLLRSLSISGCPDACSRHPVAQLGFMGSARRVNGRTAPHYVVMLGAKLEPGSTSLARDAGILSARAVPAFVTALLKSFRASPAYPDFDAYLAGGGWQTAFSLIASLQAAWVDGGSEEMFVDWGTDKPFSLAGRGPGECGAGVLDVIQSDLDSAKAALEKGDAFTAIVYASRALLVTRGVEPLDHAGVLAAFRREFLHTGLVGAQHARLLQVADLAVARGDAAWEGIDVEAFVSAIRALYETMDDSLQFAGKAASETEPSSAETAPERTADLRGVACPLNFVRAKMILSSVKPGQRVRFLLDGAGATNVPESLAKEGHSVQPVRNDDGFAIIVERC